VLLCFVDPILGNRYGPGVSSVRYHWPGVAGNLSERSKLFCAKPPKISPPRQKQKTKKKKEESFLSDKLFPTAQGATSA